MKIKNITDGPKLLNARPQALVQAGESGDFDLSDAEAVSARRSGWFEIEGDFDEGPEPGPLDQSVEKLTAYLETVDDADEVEKLIEAERGGKSRTGAIAALEARRDALLA